jgi:hypothetical protein
VGVIAHGLFVDESGEGLEIKLPPAPRSKRSLWVAAGVCVPWDRLDGLAQDVRSLISKNLTGSLPELKGFDIERHLRPQSSIDAVAQDVAEAVQGSNSKIWVVAAASGAGSVPGLAAIIQRTYNRPVLPKDNARQLLLERVNGYAVPKYHPAGSWLLVWDLSQAHELRDFSRSVVEFQNLSSGSLLRGAMVPALLGGLSHDWAPIQIADFYANLALNLRAQQMGIVDATIAKANAFSNRLMQTLVRDSTGKLVGWKTWG